MKLKNDSGEVWSFVDVFMLLMIVFMVMAQLETKDSSASDRPIPKINVYLETTSSGYSAKCNGRSVQPHELTQIIKLCKRKEVKKVEVRASIEESVPYGFIDLFIRAARSAEDKELQVYWNSTILVNFSK